MTQEEKNLLIKSLNKWYKKWKKEKNLKGAAMCYQANWLIASIYNKAMSKDHLKELITDEINFIKAEYEKSVIKQRIISLNCRRHVLQWTRNTLNYNFKIKGIINICNNVL